MPIGSDAALTAAATVAGAAIEFPSPQLRQDRLRYLPTMLRADGVSKSYPAVQALDRVTIEFAAGEVHGVIGENGAGKSTLMKILAGLERPDAGAMTLDGERYGPRDVREAMRRGVAMIHQELNLVGDLSIAENVLLGREPRRAGFLRRDEMAEQTRQHLAEVGCDLDPRLQVRSLPVAQQQLVEIAKALSQQARILIMDEPTAVLSERETASLFGLIRRLRTAGATVIYISHLLPEVRALCDRISVLRDGRLVAATHPDESDEARLAALMVGRELTEVFPPRAAPPPGPPRIHLRNLVRRGCFEQVSLSIGPGEIVGLAGLVGSGRTEVAETVVGLHRASGGSIEVEGVARRFRGPAQALAAGVAYLSEDRKGRGVLLDMNCRENVTLANLAAYGRIFPRRTREREAFEGWRRDLAAKAPEEAAAIRTLSGGNQQKLALAKWLDAQPRVLLLDEPTRGVDVGAKREIYRLIHRLAADGLACLLISSELPELLGLCHRIAVLRSGRLAGVLDGETASEDAIMRLAAGVKESDRPGPEHTAA